MKPLHIITPVKDSIDSTLETIEAILSSKISVPFHYTIYNDFSTAENTATLEKFVASKGDNISLVNLSEITTHPSPNYLLVLQMSRCMPNIPAKSMRSTFAHLCVEWLITALSLTVTSKSTQKVGSSLELTA